MDGSVPCCLALYEAPLKPRLDAGETISLTPPYNSLISLVPAHRFELWTY